MESHGQRRRCRRGMMRGHGGPWWHGMRGGGCGPWAMRGGRFGCHPRGRGGWCGAPPAAWCHEQPAAAATTTGQQPPAGAPQTADNSATPATTVPDTNAETGEMAVGLYEATAATTDQDWTLVNGGGIDVDAATTGVEQLHVSPAADVINSAPPRTCSNASLISSFFCKSYVLCFTLSGLQ